MTAPIDPPTLEPVKQMPYLEALDYAIFAVNTWMHPDASEARDIIALETNSDAIVATLVDIRDVVAGWGGPAPTPATAFTAAGARALDEANTALAMVLDEITGGSCDSHTEPEPTCSVCHAVLLLEEMR